MLDTQAPCIDSNKPPTRVRTRCSPDTSTYVSARTSLVRFAPLRIMSSPTQAPEE